MNTQAMLLMLFASSLGFIIAGTYGLFFGLAITSGLLYVVGIINTIMTEVKKK
jgi:hypothetical protein